MTRWQERGQVIFIYHILYAHPTITHTAIAPIEGGKETTKRQRDPLKFTCWSEVGLSTGLWLPLP